MKQRTRVMHNGDDLAGFNMMNKKFSGDEDNDMQLHKVRAQDHFIEAQVQENDTLQAIALRFRCPVAELKRINQIHKDNEIYARRTIKVPVTPYSVLTELVPMSEAGESAQSISEQVPSSSLQDSIDNNKNNNDKKVNNDFAIDCNEVVMNSTLAPSVVPYTDAEINEPVSEDTKLLPAKDKAPVETIVVKHLTSQGADFGIKWYHLVCCLLVLCVVTPLVYVLFYLDKHEHSDVPPLQATR